VVVVVEIFLAALASVVTSAIMSPFAPRNAAGNSSSYRSSGEHNILFNIIWAIGLWLTS